MHCCFCINFPKLPNFAGFEIFTALLIKTQVFWDVTPCRQVIIDDSKDADALYFAVKSFLLDNWTPKNSVCSFETSVTIYHSTQSNSSQDLNRYSSRVSY